MAITVKQTGNLNSFGSALSSKHEKILDGMAEAVKRNQQERLITRVKDFSGNLFAAIRVEKRGRHARAIGPNQHMAPYAAWIEDGHPSQEGGFMGYRYVADSLRNIQLKFNSELTQSIRS